MSNASVCKYYWPILSLSTQNNLLHQYIKYLLLKFTATLNYIFPYPQICHPETRKDVLNEYYT